MIIELNLWIQSNATFRANLNIDRGAFRISLGRLKTFSEFTSNSNNVSANIDREALFASISAEADYVEYNPKNAYAKAFITGLEYHLPYNRGYSKKFKTAPDISFRN